MQGKKIILTDDGSHSIFSEKFQSTYHSTHGAVQESNHIFIKHGIEYFLNLSNKNSISILEYGFGTGLNALLTLQYIIDKKIKLEYFALEAYPISLNDSNKLNYFETATSPLLKEPFKKMHSRDNLIKSNIYKNFILSKEKTQFEEFRTTKKFDLIYFDVFSPDIQSHLWQRPFLDQVIANLSDNGILITYGAKGTFKRALKNLGLIIENPPGPPGKREITRAIKQS